MDDFTSACRYVIKNKPGGVCVIAAILANIGGPEVHGTQKALIRHGLMPTGDSKCDIQLHLQWHKEEEHRKQLEDSQILH